MKTDLNALQQAIDTTWGRSSTPKSATFSVKMSINQNGDLNINFMTIVNVRSTVEMIQAKRLHADDADTMIDKLVKTVKSRYKEISGSTIKLSIDSDTINDSFEFTNMNVHTGNKTAYFRRSCVANVS
jgi:hypothetical protein